VNALADGAQPWLNSVCELGVVPAEVDRETHVKQGDLSASAHPPSADSTDASTKRGSQINYQSP
jgi:hypothetical protein